MWCGEEHHSGHTFTTRQVWRLFRAGALGLCIFLLSCTTAQTNNDFADAEIPDADAPWPDDAWLVHLDLGVTQTAGSAASEALTFTVPQGTTALQLTLTATAGHELQVAELTSETDAIVPGDWLQLSDQPWIRLDGQERVRASAWQAAFLVPNAPQVPVTPGRWQLRTFAFDYDPQSDLRAPIATGVDVQVDLVRKPNATAGTIDLNLCLTGARGITAATAPDHPRVREALKTVALAWGKVGVKIGQVRYFDVPVTALDVTHDDGADAQLAAVMRLAAGQPQGIPIFLFESVSLRTSSGLVVARGFTPGLPGPRQVGGPRTGIALALDNDEPDMLGVVMAHELGHFLGLFHVVELHAQGEVAIEDRLPDTAPAPNNLMYPTPDPAHLEITPQQGAVVLGGPWVQP